MVQITLITGGGIGIGAATAHAFARAGSHIACDGSALYRIRSDFEKIAWIGERGRNNQPP